MTALRWVGLGGKRQIVAENKIAKKDEEAESGGRGQR